MRSLCIDTSVLASIAIVEDGRTLGRVVDPDPRHQAEGLGLLLTRGLEHAGLPTRVRDARLDRIVVGTGPGPFTALRAGIAFASALGQGLARPVLGVPSLEALGLQALEHQALDSAASGDEVSRDGEEPSGVMPSVLVMTDARRKEVYAAAYSPVAPAIGAQGAAGQGRVLERVMAPWVGKIGEVPALTGRDRGDGPLGMRAYFAGPVPAHLVERLEALGATPLELDPARLAEVVDQILAADPDAALGLEPLYLRRPDIHGVPA